MKKIIALLLCILVIFSCVSVSTVSAKEDTVKSDYPYIFIPGLAGWGTDLSFYEYFPYWGGGFTIGQLDNLMKILNDNGIEAYAAAPGPFSSAWDRTCEVYAALMGTVVDYGKAHSEAHNHDRYGFSYEGKPLMGEPWNMEEKINILGYSFGGEVARLLTSLLAFGNEDELNATGEETSELFKGGHKSVHACINLSSPHNGTPVANALVDTKLPMMLLSLFFHSIGSTIGNNLAFVSFQLGHFGITPKQNEKRVKFNLKTAYNFYKANDNSGYDMTIRGAAELNEMIELSPDTYYYSYNTYATEAKEPGGKQVLLDNTNALFYGTALIINLMEGMTVDGIKIEGDWAINDGVVPLASSRYPYRDEATARSYEEAIANNEVIEKGRWYYMEPFYKMDHFDFCGIHDFPTSMTDFYFGMIEMIRSR